MTSVMPLSDPTGTPDRATARDADLVARISAGDDQAFEELIRTFGGRMQSVARRFLRCQEDRNDALQDAFISAFRGIDGFAGGASLGTWLHRIVVNACLMKLRSQSRRHAMPIDDLLPTFDDTGHHTRSVVGWHGDPVARLSNAETRMRVRACIDQLPESYREILLLRDIEEIDTEQTATMLGLSQAAVKTRLHRARQALRTLLAPFFCCPVNAETNIA